MGVVSVFVGIVALLAAYKIVLGPAVRSDAQSQANLSHDSGPHRNGKVWASPLINVDELWAKYVQVYDNRRALKASTKKFFEKNINIIVRHNHNSSASFTMGVNQFTGSDLADKERKLAIFHPHSQKERANPLGIHVKFGLNKVLRFPAAFDWRLYNIGVSRVRDQGDCGSCWAISTAGSLEALGAWLGQDNTELSEQELVDCSKKDFGCEGGWFESAFAYVAAKPNQWLNSAREYEYTGTQNECRRRNSPTNGIRLVGANKVAEDDEEALREALITRGPLPIAMHVTPNLYMYNNGIFQDHSCSKNSINHAVLLVGYGEDATHGPYWILKNSWGLEWGESGFFRLARGQNMCGVASYAVVPHVVA